MCGLSFPVGFALSQNMAIPVSELLNSLCNIISKGFFPKVHPTLLLSKFIAAKLPPSPTLDSPDLAA